MNSITYRITGLMFMTVALTVFILIYMANSQMTELFQEYLVVQQMEMMKGGTISHGVGVNQGITVMGTPEETFLASVHQSLAWVGIGILMIGLAASYVLARSITVPLRNLSSAAEQIEQGNFDQKVVVETQDEVGHLAVIFNRMTETLAINTKLRRQLLANIAHELKTPLAIIQGHLEGMLDGIIDMNKVQIASLHEEAIRLNRLIQDLRVLSLAEVRQLLLEKQATDVNQLVNRAVNMLKPLADEKKITVERTLQADIPEILVDADRISQVLYNLMGNALRYTPDNGLVQVATKLTTEFGQGWIEIRVQDNGPGIQHDDLPYIFDHFYRGDKSRDRRRGGSGLGLAIVKQLVEIHGGRVDVESKLGGGSIFYILLPISHRD